MKNNPDYLFQHKKIMKKINIILLILVTTAFAQAQDVSGKLSDAKSSYKSGDLENARFALQEALNEVNQTIGNEILSLLPKSMGSMSVVTESDNVTGTNLGFAGLYVNRDYVNGENTSTFEIVSDSPLLSGISTLLTMSVFMAADPNQKRIKVDGYKALLTRDENENGIVSYSMQLPFGSSLLTFESKGISSEEEIMGMINSIPVSDIVRLAE